MKEESLSLSKSHLFSVERMVNIYLENDSINFTIVSKYRNVLLWLYNICRKNIAFCWVLRMFFYLINFPIAIDDVCVQLFTINARSFLLSREGRPYGGRSCTPGEPWGWNPYDVNPGVWTQRYDAMGYEPMWCGPPVTDDKGSNPSQLWTKANALNNGIGNLGARPQKQATRRI